MGAVVDTVPCRVCGVRLRADREVAHMRNVHPREAFEPTARRTRRRPRPSFYVTTGARRAIFAFLLVAVFVLAATMLLRSVNQGAPVESSATVVRVSMSGFDPSAITVKAGTPLRIDLVNMDNRYHSDGGGWHNFAMDDFAMNVSVEPLGQQVFTVPTSTPGTYGWYCNVCCGGRDSPAMNGRVIIQA